MPVHVKTAGRTKGRRQQPHKAVRGKTHLTPASPVPSSSPCVQVQVRQAWASYVAEDMTQSSVWLPFLFVLIAVSLLPTVTVAFSANTPVFPCSAEGPEPFKVRDLISDTYMGSRAG